MPKLGEITETVAPTIPLKRLPWLSDGGKIVAGGSYLLAGEPGVGKTTIAMQLALDLAAQGVSVLYITNEQSASDLKTTAARLLAGDGFDPGAATTAGENLDIEALARLEDLEVWRNHVFTPDGHWAGAKCIVLDSIQGGGLSPTARRSYTILERFVQAAKAHRITTLLIAHVTKAGSIAGPKDLEHAVDVVFQFKRAFKMRPLFVPKNRFGPAKLDPIPLVMGEGGLYLPPHAKPTGTTISAVDFSELAIASAQAKVQFPKWGEKPGLDTPYLPRQKIGQLVRCLSDLPDVDASALTYYISCLMPGNKAYSFGFDLAVVVAILSSYLQREIPKGIGFYGEIDLHGNLLSPISGGEGKLYKEWSKPVKSIDPDEEEDAPSVLADFVERVKVLHQVVVPKDSEKGLKQWKSLPELQPVSTIAETVTKVWPDVA